MDDNTSAFIYALIDPRDNQARYVGKTNNPKKRLQSHLTKRIVQEDSYKGFWLRSLAAEGLLPKLVVLEKVSESRWKQAEVFYVNLLREQGHSLTNVMPGGNGGMPVGPNKGRKMSAEWRKKLSLAKLGKPLSPERRQALAALHTGRPCKPETRARIAASNAKQRYLVTFPDGTTAEVTNMSEFCREHGLFPANVYKVIKGERKTCQGFIVRRL